jgi:methylated-DNA-[protein]-cysteine S-methyltransferase
MKSKVGELCLYASDKGLAAIAWENQELSGFSSSDIRLDDGHPILLMAERQLEEYFTGSRKGFEIPLDFCIGTSFQKSVWNALLSIPYGETRSYAQIAIQIGNERAVRAVGAANGKNPIPIIVPCHRVIGSSGTLVGFAGGLENKRILLDHEFSHALMNRELACV